MKKLAITLGALALGASMAFAYGPGMAKGSQSGGFGTYQGYSQNVGPGWCGCPGAGYYAGQQQTVEPLTEDEARAKVQEFLAANLKGYEISNVQQFNVPRGQVYQFSVSDDNGNTLILRVNPFGYVVGPFTTGTSPQ